MATRIKFCGITRLEDAVTAVDAGAWAIGFILWPNSPRFIPAEEAHLIARQLRRKVRVAGVFVDQGLDEVVRTAEQIGLDLIQLHGNEGPAYCSEVQHRTGAQVIKAARVRTLGDVTALQAYRIDVDFHLLDAFVEGEPGGTGKTFDHTLAREHRRRTALILSGGLNAENVGDAIKQVAPFAVDVSSGVEVSPGVKDPDLIRAFAAAVVAADPKPAHPEGVPEGGTESDRREAPAERGDWPAGSAEETTDERGHMNRPDTGEEVAQMRDEHSEPHGGDEPEVTPESGPEAISQDQDPAAAQAANDEAIDAIVAQSEGTDVVDEAAEAELDEQDPLEESSSFGNAEADLVVGDADDGDGWTEVTSDDAAPAGDEPRQARAGGYRGPRRGDDDRPRRGRDSGDFDPHGSRGGYRGGREDRPRGGAPRERGGYQGGERSGGGGYRNDREDRPRGGGYQGGGGRPGGYQGGRGGGDREDRPRSGGYQGGGRPGGYQGGERSGGGYRGDREDRPRGGGYQGGGRPGGYQGGGERSGGGYRGDREDRPRGGGYQGGGDRPGGGYRGGRGGGDREDRPRGGGYQGGGDRPGGGYRGGRSGGDREDRPRGGGYQGGGRPGGDRSGGYQGGGRSGGYQGGRGGGDREDRPRGGGYQGGGRSGGYQGGGDRSGGGYRGGREDRPRGGGYQGGGERSGGGYQGGGDRSGGGYRGDREDRPRGGGYQGGGRSGGYQGGGDRSGGGYRGDREDRPRGGGYQGGGRPGGYQGGRSGGDREDRPRGGGGYQGGGGRSGGYQGGRSGGREDRPRGGGYQGGGRPGGYKERDGGGRPPRPKGGPGRPKQFDDRGRSEYDDREK